MNKEKKIIPFKEKGVFGQIVELLSDIEKNLQGTLEVVEQQNKDLKEIDRRVKALEQNKRLKEML